MTKTPADSVLQAPSPPSDSGPPLSWVSAHAPNAAPTSTHSSDASPTTPCPTDPTASNPVPENEDPRTTNSSTNPAEPSRKYNIETSTQKAYLSAIRDTILNSCVLQQISMSFCHGTHGTSGGAGTAASCDGARQPAHVDFLRRRRKLSPLSGSGGPDWRRRLGVDVAVMVGWSQRGGAESAEAWHDDIFGLARICGLRQRSWLG